MGKRESTRSLPAFRLERSQKHYRRRQHVGSAEMYACQTFGSRLFAAFSARLSFLTPRGGQFLHGDILHRADVGLTYAQVVPFAEAAFEEARKQAGNKDPDTA